MPHLMFAITDVNPNDTTGGGGCVCDPRKQIDCKPPYAVFYGNDMEDIASPHVVICEACAAHVLLKMNGEHLKAGENMTPSAIDAESFEDEEDIPEV